MPAPHRCPKCLGPMVLRTGYLGQFWGCEDFPNCNGTVSAKGQYMRKFTPRKGQILTYLGAVQKKKKRGWWLRDQFLGKTMTDAINSIDPALVDEAKELIKQSLITGQPIVKSEWKREIPTESGHYWAYCEKDGDMMDVHVNVAPDRTVIENGAGHVLGVIGPLMSAEQFSPVFSHFRLYTTKRPEPP